MSTEISGKPRLVRTAEPVKMLRSVGVGVANGRDAEGPAVALKLKVELTGRGGVVVMLKEEVVLHSIGGLSVCRGLSLIEVGVKREKLSSPCERDIVATLLRLITPEPDRSPI